MRTFHIEIMSGVARAFQRSFPDLAFEIERLEEAFLGCLSFGTLFTLLKPRAHNGEVDQMKDEPHSSLLGSSSHREVT